MKILLGSHHFFPSTGGIETVSDLLASEFLALGHEVRVVTQTNGAGDFPYPVVRQPGMLELLRQVRWCDVFLQNNTSLRTLWPLLFVRRPLCVVHQTWIKNAQGGIGWPERLKLFALRFAKSLSISDVMAKQIPAPSIKVGNPYDDKIFTKNSRANARQRDLIFVGRLVSDKGVDLLVEALSILRESKITPELTIVGDGPERATLERQIAGAGLGAQVEFLGSKRSRELAEILNRHRILVVPSRWAEPFGLVALEAIGCGCVVVGSSEGGLPEAIGPCGITFPNNDARALATALAHLLENPSRCDALRAETDSHLARFSRRAVANRYLEAMSATR